MRHALVAASFALLALGTGASARQAQESQPAPDQLPPVTFRVEVNYVEVDAVVRDQRGNFVRGLTRDDFEILEDGKPQAITNFSMVDIPFARAERPLFAESPLEPDVRSNAREFDGRLYVIVLDDLHTHPARSNHVRAAARRFVEQHLGVNDMAAVIHTSGWAAKSQEFTGNPRLLLSAIDQFNGRKLRSGTLERIDEFYRRREMEAETTGGRLPSPEELSRGGRLAGNPLIDPLDMERGFQARSAFRTLRNVADRLAGIRGRRKALIYISEGIDYDLRDIFNASQATNVIEDAREAVAAATRANVAIYAMDPRGLASLSDELMEIVTLPDAQYESLGLGFGSLSTELRMAHDGLRVLAEQTGGFAALDSNDFEPAFARLVHDNSAYYVLGYYPANTRRDGRFRKIDVRLRQPGLQVYARQGYIAPGRDAARRVARDGDAASPEVRDLLHSPLPVSGLTLGAFAAPFKGAASTASVVVGVEIDGRHLGFAERDGLFHGHVEVALIAVDPAGEVRGGDRHAIDLQLRPQTRDAVAARGVRVFSRLALDPGRYQLRIAARDDGTGSTGSVLYDLEVPDFTGAPLEMSGLVLTSLSAATVPTPKPDADLDKGLPGPATTSRLFRPEDAPVLFAEIYDNTAAPAHQVDIRTTIRGEDGRVLFTQEDQRSSAELGGGRGGYGYTVALPVHTFPAGPYLLRVEAASRLGGVAPVVREVPFRVEAGAARSGR